MASSDPEIRDGLTLPVWMKTKPTKDFEPFARSPPAPEDTFFYIRYPKSDLLFGNQQVKQDVPNVVADHSNGLTTAASYNIVKEKDWSKHTKPCQDVLHGIAPINTAVNPVSAKPKPAGIDDGFKGEGAACGNSIVKVAQDMISSTRPGRGFAVASPVDSEEQPDPHHYRLATRRGSKSLPVTPAHSPNTSPTSRRRKNGNRYFTSPFEPTEDTSNRSWLTMALLGFKKDLTTSTSTLAEEDTIEARLNGGTLVESVENLGPAPQNKDSTLMSNDTSKSQTIKPTKMSHAFRPKPSELREMNFWSPTSM